MQIKHIEKANEILEKIKAQERAVELLESGGTIKVEGTIESNIGMFPFTHDFPVEFEDWEIRLIIHQKKQRIEALKKEMEAM